jgi:hypothetical protein
MMANDLSRREWERLAPNPDLAEDLGYELSDLEAYRTDDEDVLVLPQDEDMVCEDAFIIVAEENLVTLSE